MRKLEAHHAFVANGYQLQPLRRPTPMSFLRMLCNDEYTEEVRTPGKLAYFPLRKRMKKGETKGQQEKQSLKKAGGEPVLKRSGQKD